MAPVPSPKPPLTLSIRMKSFLSVLSLHYVYILLWVFTVPCLKLSIYICVWSPQSTKSLRARILFYLSFGLQSQSPYKADMEDMLHEQLNGGEVSFHGQARPRDDSTTVYSEPAYFKVPAKQGQMSTLWYVREGQMALSKWKSPFKTNTHLCYSSQPASHAIPAKHMLWQASEAQHLGGGLAGPRASFWNALLPLHSTPDPGLTQPHHSYK